MMRNLAVVLTMALAVPTMAFGKRPKDVNVVNSPTVQIDSSANTVKLDGSANTVKLDSSGNTEIGRAHV